MPEIPMLGTPMEDSEMRRILGDNAKLRKISIVYQDDDGMECAISYVADDYIKEESAEERT
jgi:hypothetical protein